MIILYNVIDTLRSGYMYMYYKFILNILHMHADVYMTYMYALYPSALYTIYYFDCLLLIYIHVIQ